MLRDDEQLEEMRLELAKRHRVTREQLRPLVWEAKREQQRQDWLSRRDELAAAEAETQELDEDRAVLTDQERRRASVRGGRLNGPLLFLPLARPG